MFPYYHVLVMPKQRKKSVAMKKNMFPRGINEKQLNLVAGDQNTCIKYSFDQLSVV